MTFLDTTQLDLAKEMMKNNFINTVSIRFILLFLIVLLVKMLFAYMKYCIRMKNFYESKLMAIQLSGIEDLERLKAFSETFATDKIDMVVEELGSAGMGDIIKSMFGK